MVKLKLLLKYVPFIIFSVIVLLPFIWTLYAALTKNDLDLNSSISKWTKYGLDNFRYILHKGDILVWFKNSILVVTIITFLNLVVNTMAGYALARFNFQGNKPIFMYITGIMMIPMQVLVIPIFLVVSKLGMVNSYLGLIFPFCFNPFGVFLMRQFFLKFPREIEEASEIDGLGKYGTFIKIVLPLAKTALLAQAILIFVWNWNSFMLPSILVNTPDKFTLPLGIYQITNTQYVTSVSKAMAGATLALIPTIIFYFIFQNRLISTDIGASIKG